jgi:beta-hydroxylase
MAVWLPSLRYWILGIYLASALYIHFRGRVRFKLARALTDFNVLLAPLNALMYLGSKVPPTPFLKPEDFPQLAPLRDHWEEIREEALRLDDEGYIKAANGYTDIGFNSFFRTGWTRFYLKWYGQDLESAKKLCPRTVEIVNSIPGIKAAMFTSLPPGARLVRHRDPYAGSLRYHLGLSTPNAAECFIEVDGERYSWHDGEAVMFDETYIHYAENKTDHRRVIFFCDVERPVWSAPLRWLNSAFGRLFMKAAATQNLDSEPIGFINRVFFHGYKLRLAGKKLKAKSRAAYYISKWAVILGVLALILFW